MGVFKFLWREPNAAAKRPDASPGLSPTAPVIIFIHGLGSGPAIWEQMIDLCRGDPDLGNFALDTFSYPTALFGVGLLTVMPKVEDIARGLNTFLRMHHGNRERIILVCHSLGGVVGRQLVVNSAKAGDDISRFCLVLFACPNNGSALAEVARNFSIGHRHIGQLGRNTQLLKDLNQDWQRLKIPERAQLVFVAGAADGVVQAEDARAFCELNQAETIIDANHSTIVRPTCRDGTAYRLLRAAALGEAAEHKCSTKANPADRPANPLFEVYYKADEPFYVERNIDRVLASDTAISHMWLYGHSGLGKTSALRRRVLRSSAAIHQVMLAGESSSDPIDLLRTICRSMEERLDLPLSSRDLNDSQHLTQRFCLLTRELARGGYLFLQIEEIPFSDAAHHLAFLKLIFLCSQALELEERRHTTLYLSSITDPRIELSDPLHKMDEKLLFVQIEEWGDPDLAKLIALISGALGLPCSTSESLHLRDMAGGSPRFIKRFFRIWRVKQEENLSFDHIAQLTLQEQVVR